MIGKTISHYEILAKLGEGGMGVVYKVEDTKLKRLVALKFLPSSFMASEAEKTRFVHEAQAAAALNHPNIYTIYEIDEVDGQVFIAMEFVEGQNLKTQIDAGPLKLDEALSITTQIAQGLAKAHEHSIVHRDIKPANVIIAKDGVAKILDFGLAKFAGQPRLTKTGSTLGTMAYMSPEQARGEEVDHRTDIWALGVVLYEMITGQLPFRGEYEHAVMYSILNEDPKPIMSLHPDVPITLERIVKKALAKRADERYQHTSEMLADLRALRKEIESASVKKATSDAMLKNRKRSLLYAGVAGLVVLFIGIGLYLLQRLKPATTINSIAVLPLTNLSGDPEQEYFADGMTEALIADLAQIEALKVISRTSVMQYKEYKGAKKSLPQIAKELNVDAVVEGSVLRAGERVRITAQLIEAATDRHLWAKNYEKDLRDILVLQSEVAWAIANEIKVKLTPQAQARLTSTRPVNPEAHEAYLKGRFYWNKYTAEGFKKSIDYFHQALEKDPAYALAYAGLADAYNILAVDSHLPPNEVMPKAKAAAIKALELDETLAEAHVSLGIVKLFYDWDWVGAERELKRAIELNPNNSDAYHFYGHYLEVMGRTDEAITVTKRGLELDPLSLIINAELGYAYHYSRQYDEAITQYRKTLELDPNFVFASWAIGQTYEQKGIYEAAITELNKARPLSGDWPFIVAELGCAYARSGQKTKARQILDELKARAMREFIDPGSIAFIHIDLGETDQAFAWLQKAYEERTQWIIWLQVDPKFDRLRSDPRFATLLKKVGLRP